MGFVTSAIRKAGGFLSSVKGDSLVRLPGVFDPNQDPTTDIVVIKGWEELKSRTLSLVSDANPGTLAPTVRIEQALQRYRSWVYPCVNLIQNRASAVPYYLYEEIGQPNDEEFNRILDHPCIQILKRPNKAMTGNFLKRITQLHLDLCGCAFWLKVRSAMGKPVELYPLNPHELVNIELGDSTDRPINKFVFSSRSHKQYRREYPVEDIVYFHYPHPWEPLIPHSPIQAYAHAADIDLYLQVYEKDFFQNNARPDFVIVAEQAINKEQAERIAEGWMNKHRGPGKQHRPAILSKNVRIEQLGMSAKDFEFLALSEWTKDMILAAYAVPEAMLGLYEMFNKASSITAQTTFVEECLQPRLKLFEDVINLQLLPEFDNTRRLEFKHESALPKDDEMELAKNQTELMLGLTTINEIRKRQGRKPWKSKLFDVPWINGEPVRGEDSEADTLWEEATKVRMGIKFQMPAADPMQALLGGQAGAIPPIPGAQGSQGVQGGRPEGVMFDTLIRDAIRLTKPGLDTLLNAARGKRGGIDALIQAHPEWHRLDEVLDRQRGGEAFQRALTKTIHDEIMLGLNGTDRLVFKEYEEALSSLEEIEEKYATETEKFMVKKGHQISELVKKASGPLVEKSPMENMHEEDFREEYKQSARDYALKAAKIGFNFGLKLVNKAVSDNITIDPEEEAQKAAGRFLDKSADLRVKSVKNNITKIIQSGIKEGLSIEDVSELIRKKFSAFGIKRASMIARTEMMGALNEGTMASFERINEEAGKAIVKKAISWSSLDERVCNDKNPNKNCTKKHNQVIKDFESGVEYMDPPPHHPLCRCVVIAET